ncbi:MAG: glutamate-1-semialdehyde aminotransferase [Sphaerochaetaceae bacterium]
MSRQTDVSAYTMPTVVRAREYHLYDPAGRRYVDFFQNHGRAILGHRPDGVLRALKATASRGLIAEYPSIYQGRLEKLLKQLIPGFITVRFYNGREKAVEMLRQALGSDIPLVIADPALADSPQADAVSFWRPFLPDMEVLSDILLPILPFPGNFVPEVVCARNSDLIGKLPPSDPVSPLLLDLLVKSTAPLLGKAEEDRARLSRRNPLDGIFPHVRGPYCITGLSTQCYRDFHRAAFEAQVVLPPGPEIPIISPFWYSDGEVAAFLEVARAFASPG